MAGSRRLSDRVVLFDLDGALVDTFPGIASAYRHVLVEMGLEEVDDDGIRPLIGPPIQVGLRPFFGLSGSRLEEGIRIFREHYGAKGLYRFTKYPGIEETIVALKDADFDLYIATSKLRSMAVEVVARRGAGPNS